MQALQLPCSLFWCVNHASRTSPCLNGYCLKPLGLVGSNVRPEAGVAGLTTLWSRGRSHKCCQARPASEECNSRRPRSHSRRGAVARAVLPLEPAERSHQLHTSDSNCSRCGLFYCMCDDDMETRSVVSIDETTALALAPIQVCNPVGDELRLCLPEIALGSQTAIGRTTMELCGQELDIPIPSAIPFVRFEVPHLLEIAGPGTGSLNINLNTFAVAFQARSWFDRPGCLTNRASL